MQRIVKKTNRSGEINSRKPKLSKYKNKNQNKMGTGHYRGNLDMLIL